MKHILFSFFVLISTISHAQDQSVMTLEEYIAFVKAHHPIVKQADIKLREGEAKLLKARGAVDPKIGVDFDRKRFKDKDYFNRLNTAFKIPTWYGIDFKGSYQYHNGAYLNPMDKLPKNGLYSVGVSVDVTRELFFNKRIATLKKAKLYQSETEAKNQLLINDLLYESVTAYAEWLKAYQEQEVYKTAIQNVERRLKGVKQSVTAGDKPAIDTTEVMIVLNTQKLNLEKANLKYTKASIALSNYLWVNDIPVEIKPSIIPDINTDIKTDNVLGLNAMVNFDAVNHPKINAINLKQQNLDLERRVKRNSLFPKIKLQYNFLNANPSNLSYYELDNYKGGISVTSPIFYRKQKAELKLTEYKIKALDFEKSNVANSIKNKFSSIQQEITSLKEQQKITQQIIRDYATLVNGEKKKFDLGESSIFLVNYREIKLIESQLKAIDLNYKILKSKGAIFNIINNG